MVDDCIRFCNPQTRLCIAMGITCDEENIRTLPLAEWRRRKPDLPKTPCIFLLYK